MRAKPKHSSFFATQSGARATAANIEILARISARTFSRQNPQPRDAQRPARRDAARQITKTVSKITIPNQPGGHSHPHFRAQPPFFSPYPCAKTPATLLLRPPVTAHRPLPKAFSRTNPLISAFSVHFPTATPTPQSRCVFAHSPAACAALATAVYFAKTRSLSGPPRRAPTREGARPWPLSPKLDTFW
jgi:hypothetical protein